MEWSGVLTRDCEFPVEFFDFRGFALRTYLRHASTLAAVVGQVAALEQCGLPRGDKSGVLPGTPMPESSDESSPARHRSSAKTDSGMLKPCCTEDPGAIVEALEADCGHAHEIDRG